MSLRLLPLTLLITLALVAAACAPDEPVTAPDDDPAAVDDDGDEPDDAPAPADVPQELVVGVGPDEFATSDINMKRLGMYPMHADICEPLVRLTEDFGVEPVLATDWEHVGGNTFEFYLRDGVTFHDGSTLDAEAVKYTLDYTAAEPATGGFTFVGEASTEVVDDMTVAVTPEEPNMRLVEQINHPTFGVLAPGSDPLENQDPVCTGPFRLVEYEPEEHFIVERNPDYWGEPPTLERITFRFIPDSGTRVLALQSGEVDVIADVERGLAASIRDTPGLRIVEAPPGQVILFYIARRGPDGEEKITADPAVRRAIAHAIDRDTYVEAILDGNANRIETVNPPVILGEHADLVEGIPHDPDEAVRVLEEAGWTEGDDGVRVRDGERLELTIIFDPARIELSTAEYVQDQLSRVGIDARVDQLESAAYRERLNTGTDYELDLSAPNQNDGNPAFLLALRWYAKARVPNAEFVSPGEDTEFERLIDQTQTTDDPEELQRLAAEAMKILVEEEVATVPLAGTFRIWGMKESVQGFDPHPSGINQRWRTVFVAE